MVGTAQAPLPTLRSSIRRLLSLPLRLRRFVNLHKDFDADDGEITRTRKLRRNVVETNYDELIRALYADTSSAKSVMFDAQIAYESGEKGVIRRSLSINQVGG